MTLENLLSQVGIGTKQLTDRYSEVPVHDHHVYYAYEPSAPSHGPVATSKYNYGGGHHKSGASMSALTLLAFLFFLHILQQCIKDHMTEMSTAPVMIMTAGREGEDAITKSATFNKIDKTGVTDFGSKDSSVNDRTDTINQNKITENYDVKNPYNNDGPSSKHQLLKVKTEQLPRSEETKQKYVFKNYANRSSMYAGFYSAMDEE
ncbi:unnamed protein product [Spodoptera littoralis]|uniref:Uncharacterized protein n=1 Tax=Spodoptera littoralis TaxID=7109 RepID=A0A9P0I016_SPOLI|nr:unnamed protein product [Spodoptera littoralis]CAH1636922.1 unnamed protein product [Spodoptera littoralis]